MAGKRKSTNVMFYESRGVWVASWFYDGGRRRKSMRLPTATDRETAQDEYQRRMTAVPVSVPIAAQQPETTNQKSVQTMIGVFERQVMPSYRATTQAIYRQMFGLLTKAGIKTVADFRPDKLSALTDVLLAEGMEPPTRHKMLRATRRFMRWSFRAIGSQAIVPSLEMPRVRKRSKGRPLTEAEFQALLTATDAIYHLKPERAEACKGMLTALRLSGLRIGEADVSWDDRDGFHIDWTSYSRPVFVMPDTIDKTGEDRVFPMTPDFWAFISTVPEAERTGPVFSVLSTWRHQRLNPEQLSKLIQRIGKASGVVVSRRGSKVKHASAHDLRRSFGLRWAQKVTLLQLCALMRHKDPKTTQWYYLGTDASLLLGSLWQDSAASEPIRRQAVSPTEANIEPIALRRPPVLPEMPDPEEDDPVEQPERQTHEPAHRSAKRVASRSRMPRDVVEESGTTTTESKLMRAKEVMTVLGISRQTLNALEHNKTIRVVVLSEQKRYVKEDVMKLLDPKNGPVELWSPKVAAEFVGGISTKTIVRMAESGKLRSAPTPRGHCRVYAVDVRKFAQTRS